MCQDTSPAHICSHVQCELAFESRSNLRLETESAHEARELVVLWE
jgi:hypothetical protein